MINLMNQKGFAPIIIILGVVLLLGILGGAYYFGKNSNTTVKNNSVITPSPTSSPTVAPKVDETANWKTYTNAKYGFNFKYPSETEFSLAGSSPFEEYKIVFIGQKQKSAGKIDTELYDGYIFNVSIIGEAIKNSVDNAITKTLEGDKLACPEQAQYSIVKNVEISGQLAKTYNVINCLGDSTESFVSNGRTVFELSEMYSGDKPEYDNYKQIVHKIFATFKFN